VTFGLEKQTQKNSKLQVQHPLVDVDGWKMVGSKFQQGLWPGLIPYKVKWSTLLQVKQSITNIKTPVDENHLILKFNRKMKKKDKENPVIIHYGTYIVTYN
jgi:hypothetical protein